MPRAGLARPRLPLGTNCEEGVMVPKPPFSEEQRRRRERKHFTQGPAAPRWGVGFTPRPLKFQSLNSVLLPREIILERLENSGKYKGKHKSP